jgi:hypothetical protein
MRSGVIFEFMSCYLETPICTWSGLRVIAEPIALLVPGLGKRRTVVHDANERNALHCNIYRKNFHFDVNFAVHQNVEPRRIWLSADLLF